MSRRLPVYLVLDCSESMAGPHIEAVARGVNDLLTELRQNPQALETVCLSVITFAREARQVAPLTDLVSFQPPALSVRTGTSLGAALRALAQCLDREVVKTTPTTKGDYRPLVFLMTDGQPTDDWQSAVAAFKAANMHKLANFYVIGFGDDADGEVLHRISEVVLHMRDFTPDKIRKFFVWISASVQAVSTKLEGGGGTDPINVSLPEGVEIAARGAGPRDSRPRQVFLHARCSKTKKPYLMRFRRRGAENAYDAVAAHPLDVIEEDAGSLLPRIHSSLLNGCPPCPHCGNPVAGQCPCGTLFCTPAEPVSALICPRCNAQVSFGPGSGGGDGGFEVQQSAG